MANFFEFYLSLLEWSLLGIFAAFAVLALRPVLQGRMGQGLLSSGRSAQADPERMILLVTTLGVAGYYLVTSLGLPLDALRAEDGSVTMPDIPSPLLALLFGGHGGYLFGKMKRN